MKIIITIILFSLISCKKEITSQVYSTEKNDSEEISIKFPTLSDWKELYSDPLIKERFDKNAHNGSNILAVYLTNEIANRKDNLGDFDNYSLFFTLSHEQKWKIKNTDLKRIFNIQIKKASIDILDQNEAIRKAYSDSTFITPENPYILKVYQDYQNVYSSIQLIKPFSDDHEYIVIYVYNLINIENHLIYGGYYLNFNGNESIKKAIENNDILISEFIKLNKK